MWTIKECERVEGRRGAGGERGGYDVVTEKQGSQGSPRGPWLPGYSRRRVGASEKHHRGQLGSSEAIRP